MLTLRRKILFTIVGALAILIVLLYVIADRLAFTTLQRLEEQISRQNVTRVAQTLQNELENLERTSGDYAKWDDTYQFIEEATHGVINKEYAATNFSDSNMQSNRLNLLVYVNTAGKVIVKKGFDLEGSHELPIPASFFENSFKDLLQPTAAISPKSGIMAYDYGLMLIASHPILPNSGLGPNRGSLIFGHLLDEMEIQRISALTLFPISIYPLNNLDALPADAKADITALKTSNEIILHQLDDDKITGYKTLSGIDGLPVALLEVKMKRSIQEQGHISLNYLVAALTILLLIVGAVVSYVMEQWVLSPVTELGSHVNKIGASGNLSTRLRMKGNDEIAQLAQDINQMLDALETAQQDQRRSEARYRAIFEQASEGIVFADARSHQFIAANAAFQHLTGYNANEISALTAYDIVTTDEATYAASIEQISTGQRYAVTEHIYRCKDATLLNVESSAVLLPEDNGRSIYCMVVRDITERVQAEDRLRQTQKLESIGLLAGGIAHDFNNLLTGILGQTSLALDKLSPEQPAWVNINKAVVSVKRGADLTRQLLAYAGRGQFQIEAINLNQLIRDNTSLLETGLTSEARLQLSLAPDLAPIEADRGQIQQIVMNLVINAAEAINKEHGEVIVTTKEVVVKPNDTQQYVGGNKLPAGRYICLQVSDTGSGMDKETLTRIFDPFFTTKERGTGLGLSATLGIVRAHGGGLQVTSEVGEGTTFTILFPVSNRIASQENSPMNPNGGMCEGSILVIDDEKSVREVVRDILEMNHLHVLVAPNGQIGIEMFMAHRAEINVILLDMQMPVMNGAETFQALRAIDPSIKVILSSGYNENDAVRSFVSQGLAAFLQKPYDLDALVAKVYTILEQTKTHPLVM